MPAVISLFAERFFEVCVIGSVGIRFSFFCIRDCDTESAAVIAVIAFRVDSEQDFITGFDIVGDIECFGSVFCEVAHGVAANPLLLISVEEDTDACAVGIRIFTVGKLDIFTLDVDLAVACCNPLVSRISAVARFNKVCLQFRLAVVVVSCIGFIIFELCEVLRIPVAHTIVPAIAALRTECVFQNCIVGSCEIFRLFFFRMIGNCDCKSAAVIAVVSFRIDCEYDLIACLDFIGDIECFTSVIGEVALDVIAHPVSFLTVDEDAYCCTVCVRIGIVGKLHIFTLDVNGSILGCDPLVCCISAAARFNKVCLQFRLAVVVISVVIDIIRELFEVL